MGSAFLLLFPGYSGTPTPTSPTTIRLWETGSECVYYVRFQFIRLGGGGAIAVQADKIFGILCVSFVKCVSSFPFGFEGGMWDLIVLIPGHCLSIYFRCICTRRCK